MPVAVALAMTRFETTSTADRGDTESAPATLPWGARAERPLLGYSALLLLFWTGAAAYAELRRRRPHPMSWGDFALLGAATHRVSLVLAKDRVTSVYRAPFVHYVRNPRTGELEEKHKGKGLERALGQLVTCQYCLAPWVALAFATGMNLAPRATRGIAMIFSLTAVSDFLHRLYARLRR